MCVYVCVRVGVCVRDREGGRCVRVSRPCIPPKYGQRAGSKGGVARGGVQNSRSMKAIIRDAYLLITPVLDSCEKLLVVLHISSAQGRSVDGTK